MRKKIILKSIRNGWVSLSILYMAVLVGGFISCIAPLVLGDSVNNMMGGEGSIVLSFSRIRLLLLVGIGALFVQHLNSVLQKVFYRSYLVLWIPEMCSKLNRIELRTVESFETGYLNRRISSEIKTIPQIFSQEVPGLIESALVMLFSLYMLIKLLPNVSLALVLAAVVLIPIGIPIVRKVKRLLKETIECWSKLEGVSTFFVTSQLQIRAFRAFQRIRKNIVSQVRLTTTTDLRNSIRSLLLMSSLLILITAGLIAFLIYAESSPQVATANAGTIVAFLGYLLIFTGRISGLTSVLGKMQNSLASLDRMAEFMSIPEHAIKICAIPGEKIQSMVVNNLSAAIDDKTVFSGCSFEARSGDIIAIKGKSGCGKTTLLRTLFGILPRSSGEILLNGIQVDGLNSVKNKVVYLPQEIKFFRNSIQWNLEILSGVEIDQQELKEIIDKVHLSTRIDTSSLQNINLTEGGSNLSGGEKQRLAMGAVLLMEPSIVLLDEPTSQLDAYTEKLILDIVKDLADKGSIVFFVAHKTSINRIATKAIDMDVLNDHGEISIDTL